MRLIRIPVGQTVSDKNEFVKEFLRVFPSNPKKHIEDIWERNTKASVLQIIMDVDTGFTIAIHRINEIGLSEWELSSRFIDPIPLIKDFVIEHNKSNENMDNIYDQETNIEQKSVKIPKNNVDDILDIIVKNGHGSLNDNQKSFLQRYKKK